MMLCCMQDQASDAKKHAHTLPDGSVLQMFWRATSRGDCRASVAVSVGLQCYLAQ